MKKLAIFFLSFTALPPASSQVVMTLDDCLTHGFENNPEITSAAWDVASSACRTRQSIHEFLPSAEVEFNHFVSSGKSLNIETYAWGNENIHQGNLAVNTELVVFQGFHRLLNRRMSSQELEISELALEGLKLRTGMEIIRSYYRINLLKVDAEILQNGLAETRNHIRRLQEQIASGTMARGSLYEMQAQEKKEEINREAVVTELGKAYNSLLHLLDWHGEDSLIVAQDSLLNARQHLMSGSLMHEVVQRVLQHSVILSEKRARLDKSKTQMKVGQTSLFPVIALQAGITTRYLGGAGDPEEPSATYSLFSQLSDNRFRQMSLTVCVPLFDRSRNRLQIRLAEIEVLKTEAEIRLARESLRLELLNLMADIQSLSSKIRSAETMTQAYALSYETAVEKYRSGILDPYALNQAKNNHVNAQLELSKYIIAYTMNVELLLLYERFVLDPTAWETGPQGALSWQGR